MVDKTFKAIDRFGTETEFVLKDPGILETNEADMQYKVAYSKALQAGIMPRDRMVDEIRKQGIWSDDYSQELSSLSKKIAILEYEFNKLKESEDVQKISEKALDLSKSRNRAWELITIQQGPLANSCDGIAEVIRQEALLASCVRIKANNQRYWKNYASYVEERDSDSKSTVITIALTLYASDREEQTRKILMNCPEQQWFESQKNKSIEIPSKGKRKKRVLAN